MTNWKPRRRYRGEHMAVAAALGALGCALAFLLMDRAL